MKRIRFPKITATSQKRLEELVGIDLDKQWSAIFHRRTSAADPVCPYEWMWLFITPWFRVAVQG